MSANGQLVTRQSMRSTEAIVSGDQAQSLLSSCTLLLIAILCVVATKSRNSSYRMKMSSEIIKTSLTLYSILHVPCVLKMEKRTHERYFEQQNRNELYLQNGYSPVQWQWKLFPQG